jgi:hypothetical protein
MRTVPSLTVLSTKTLAPRTSADQAAWDGCSTHALVVLSGVSDANEDDTKLWYRPNPTQLPKWRSGFHYLGEGLSLSGRQRSAPPKKPRTWPSRAPRTRRTRTHSTDPEPKMWAASPDENTPRGPNQAVRSIPRGHGTEGVPLSWSLHPVMASVWASGVQVRPPGAAGTGRRRLCPQGLLRPLALPFGTQAAPLPAGLAGGVRACRLRTLPPGL